MASENEQKEEGIVLSDQFDGQVVRGEKSWDYFYLFLGFSLTIEKHNHRHDDADYFSVQHTFIRHLCNNNRMVVPIL